MAFNSELLDVSSVHTLMGQIDHSKTKSGQTENTIVRSYFYLCITKQIQKIYHLFFVPQLFQVPNKSFKKKLNMWIKSTLSLRLAVFHGFH